MKVGLLGYGYWGKIMKPKLEDNFEVLFVADSKTHYDLNNIDWVFVTTPTETHYDIVKKCLENRVNVFCEKPLTVNHTKSTELIELSIKMGVKLYIDNIFLLRDEYKILKKKLPKIKKIDFKWFKYGPFNDSLVNSLFYHDMYLLLDMLGVNLKFKLLKSNITDNNLFVKLKVDDIDVSFEYDRLKTNIKDKHIILNNDVKISFNNPTNDSLSDTLKNIVDNNIDYFNNHKITIETEKKIKELI